MSQTPVKMTVEEYLTYLYYQTVLTGSQPIVSLTFPEINLTAQQVLAPKL